MEKQVTHKKTRVFYYENAIVTVHFADITQEEHECRMARLEQAAAELLKEVIRNEKRRSLKDT